MKKTSYDNILRKRNIREGCIVDMALGNKVEVEEKDYTPYTSDVEVSDSGFTVI